MKPWVLAVGGLAAVLCAVMVARLPVFERQQKAGPTTRPADQGKHFDHAAFDQILQNNVRDGLVDYANIKAHWMPQLKAYLDALAAQRTDDLSSSEQLAFYINLYNATAIYAVCERYHPGFSVAENHFAFFKTPLARADGELITLDDLENRMIRPWYRDARVHAALVWPARSSPPMDDHAVMGEELSFQLDIRMEDFVNDPDRFPVDQERHRVGLSPIFEWYGGDFGDPLRVVDYVNKYSDTNLAGFFCYFVPFDWSLNDAAAQRQAQGRATPRGRGQEGL